jgi:hypothetical protein
LSRNPPAVINRLEGVLDAGRHCHRIAVRVDDGQM